MSNANWITGIAYAAGYLATDLGEESLAAEILTSADLTTEEKLLEGGADEHDVHQCGPALLEIRVMQAVDEAM